MNLERFFYRSLSERINNHEKTLQKNIKKQNKVNADVNQIIHLSSRTYPRFKNFQQLVNYVHKIYKRHVQLTLLEDYPIRGIVVLSHIFIDNEYRGYGFGRNIIELINQTADEHNQIIVLEPAFNELGRIQLIGLTDNEKINAKIYQNNLIKYYHALGYSFLSEYKTEISHNVYESLKLGGSMVRFPHNRLSKNY